MKSFGVLAGFLVCATTRVFAAENPLTLWYDSDAHNFLVDGEFFL